MATVGAEVLSLETLLFQGPLVRIGAFHADPLHPRFHDSGRIENHVFVFPRTSVWIRHEGQPAFVADPNVVTFYNRGQAYRRGKIAEEGDRCEWFAVAPEVVVECVSRFEPGAAEQPERPFAMSHAASDARTYLRQSGLVQSLRSGSGADRLYVEERAIELLDVVVESALCGPTKRAPQPDGTQRRHRDLVEAAKALLAATFRESWPLEDIARALEVAPGHLCRMFRRQAGTTMHQYRDQLRLRSALDALRDPHVDLTALALDLGYSSHSHFTERFRRSFGTTPSAFRTRRSADGPDRPADRSILR
jgi:AraC-like DNA-binding protein